MTSSLGYSVEKQPRNTMNYKVRASQNYVATWLLMDSNQVYKVRGRIVYFNSRNEARRKAYELNKQEKVND